MLKLFYRSDGAISVFLSLVLLPVMIVGGMTTDAARIYMSKVIISDSGEMAMNAGLAQYNEVLHDEYGLFVMNQKPEAISGDLERFFNASLNGTGISENKGYKQILDLVSESFQAMGVAGSEIYQTDVEKQQILEYMKYRAPVCIADLILKKLDQLRDTKKMMNAMEAEMDFSEAMEECQDAFEEAKQALDRLNAEIESFPSPDDIAYQLHSSKVCLTEKVAKCLLMRGAIQNYKERSGNKDLRAIVEKFIDNASKVNFIGEAAYSERTYTSYRKALYYKNTVDHLGGAGKLLSDYKDNSDEDTDEEKEEIEELIKKYKSKKSAIEGYATVLLNIAKQTVEENYYILHGYWERTQDVQVTAQDAYKRLGEVEKKLKKAAEKFDMWKTRTSELADPGEMKKEVEEYEKFFSEGDGRSNLEKLEKLMNKVETDKQYFAKLGETLKKEKFFDLSIAIKPYMAQVNTYMSKAGLMVSGKASDYRNLESIRKGSYITNYKHINDSDISTAVSIQNDAFYQKLQEYCEQREANDSSKEVQEANRNVDDSKKAAEEANKEDDYPDFDWNSVGVSLPSVLVGGGEESANNKLTDLEMKGNVKSSGARKKTVGKFKASIKEATSFLDKVDQIVTNNLEGLYIAEYAMQMGSYYTVDKKDGQRVASDQIITISGYKLENHKAYRAECEYVLWGNNSSKKNIKYTIMTIFGIRLLFNAFFAFTDTIINRYADAAAIMITSAVPYLKPIVKVVIKLGYAGLETANDIKKIKDGYGVAIIKNTTTWETAPHGGNSSQGFTLDYSEFLRIFLNMIFLKGDGEKKILGRIGDLIQVNTDTDITQESFTMLSIQANIKVRTTFMGKASQWSGGSWSLGDFYSIPYQSVLGY